MINRYKMAKHFQLTIAAETFTFQRDEAIIAAESALDGVYVVRTSLTRDRLEAQETVHCYKNLSRVERAFRSLKTLDLQIRPIYHRLADRVKAHILLFERAFRSLKTLDLQIRPIYHRLADRVKAHILLCLLAYYVKWHLMEVWRRLLFADENSPEYPPHNPVAPAQRSASAHQKIQSK